LIFKSFDKEIFWPLEEKKDFFIEVRSNHFVY